MSGKGLDSGYADTARRLKAELLRLKTEVGDHDERCSGLMNVRTEHWKK
jgi:hypothetical protein